jgi:DNA-binding CsgD family transcriptional regulator
VNEIKPGYPPARKARVAALVGTSPSVPLFATTLGVSVNTVRAHLKRVFDKTGARSQAELARLMGSMSTGAKTPQETVANPKT